MNPLRCVLAKTSKFISGLFAGMALFSAGTSDAYSQSATRPAAQTLGVGTKALPGLFDPINHTVLSSFGLTFAELVGGDEGAQIRTETNQLLNGAIWVARRQPGGREDRVTYVNPNDPNVREVLKSTCLTIRAWRQNQNFASALEQTRLRQNRPHIAKELNNLERAGGSDITMSGPVMPPC